MSPTVTRIAFWTGCLAVLIATLTPSAHLPPIALSVWDKAEHAGAFALLYLLGVGPYSKQRMKLALGLVLFGGAIELAQAATGWRSGDWLDWLADAIGVATGMLIATVWGAMAQKLRARVRA